MAQRSITLFFQLAVPAWKRNSSEAAVDTVDDEVESVVDDLIEEPKAQRVCSSPVTLPVT